VKEIIAERNKQEPDGREISKRSIREEPDRDFSATIQIDEQRWLINMT